MPRIRKIIPGVDAEAPDQGRRQAAARSVAAAVPARRRQPRRARRCSPAATSSTATSAERRAARRSRTSTTGCRPGCSIPTGWRRPIPRARSRGRSRSTPITPRTRRRRSTAGRYKLEVGGLVDNKKPWTLDELYALPQETQITRHICVEGWSAIGKWTGRAAARLPQAHRRRHPREIRLVRCAEGYSNTDRHADRAASADADDVQVRRRDPAAQVRLPDEDPHPDQARLQEPQVRDRRSPSSTTTPAATGRTRATTGSAGCSANEHHACHVS